MLYTVLNFNIYKPDNKNNNIIKIKKKKIKISVIVYIKQGNKFVD